MQTTKKKTINIGFVKGKESNRLKTVMLLLLCFENNKFCLVLSLPILNSWRGYLLFKSNNISLVRYLSRTLTFFLLSATKMRSKKMNHTSPTCTKYVMSCTYDYFVIVAINLRMEITSFHYTDSNQRNFVFVAEMNKYVVVLQTNNLSTYLSAEIRSMCIYYLSEWMPFSDEVIFSFNRDTTNQVLRRGTQSRLSSAAHLIVIRWSAFNNLSEVR